MTKHEIVAKIQEKTGFKKKDILTMLECLIDNILKNTDKGQKIDFRRFGTFYRSEKKGRKIFSPIAQKMIDVLPRSILVFKPSKTTEREIKGG